MSKTKLPMTLTILLIAVGCVWLALGVGTYFSSSSWAERGQIGDMFGAANALFSALGIAGLIYTILLQQKQLELQMEQIGATSDELQRSVTAQEGSQRALTRHMEMAAWLKAQDVWNEKSFKDGRTKVFQRLDEPNDPWTHDDDMNALDVCRKLDEFARLAPFLGEESSLKYWDDPLAKSWIVLEPIVTKERDRSGWQTKWQGFEELGKKALAKLVDQGRDPRRRKSIES